MQVSTRCRSTVKRWITDACGSNRIRSHSGRIRSTAPVSSRVSQTARSPGPAASSRTNSWRAPSGHGSGSAGPSRTRRAVLVGESSTSRSAASAAARSSSSGSLAGSASAASTTSPAESATPGPSGSRRGLRTAAGEDGRSEHVVRPPPRQPGEVGDPPTQHAEVSLDGRGVGQPEPRRQLGPDVGPDPVPRAAGDLVQHVAGVEEGQPRTLQVDVRARRPARSRPGP